MAHYKQLQILMGCAPSSQNRPKVIQPKKMFEEDKENQNAQKDFWDGAANWYATIELMLF